MKQGRKISGGKYHKQRKKKKYELDRQPRIVKLGKEKQKKIKARGGKIKIVLGGVDPKPIVVIGIANDEKEKLIKEAVKKSRIVDNDFYSRSYRKEMIPIFLKQSFEELAL